MTIGGSPTEDETLIAANSLVDDDGLGTVGYQWQRNGLDVSGAIGATYLLGDADVGAAIAVRASYVDGQGTFESVTGAPVGPVANVNDPPVAHDSPATGHPHQPILGLVTASDVDNRPDELTYALVGPNGGALHGAVTMQSDGHFVYTPASGYAGSDTFHFLASDGSADSNVATVTIVPAIVDPQLPPPGNDFNGDGRADILWQNANGQLGIWLMDGCSPVCTAAVGPSPGPAWKAIGSGNFDWNGTSDILWQNDNGQAAIWLMDGTTPAHLMTVGPNPGPDWKVVGSGDFNGDFASDILWQNTNGQAAIWLMDGTAPAVMATVGPNAGASWKAICAGDFDGDGRSDILWQNDSGQVGVWLMDGTTPTAMAVVGPNPGPSWHAVGAGDFNGDGKSDILWQNDNGQAGVWLMNGTAPIAMANVGTNPGAAWHATGAADVSGDGKSDILWQNDNGQPGVWLMDGVTPIAETTVGANPGPAWQVVHQHHDLF